MKSLLVIVFLEVILSSSVAVRVNAQWVFVGQPFSEQPHPPGGGTSAFASTDSVIFAGGFKGVYASYDHGVTWIKSGLEDHQIYALQVLGHVLLAGGSAGIFRSTDSGSHWVAVDSGLFYSVECFLRLDSMLLMDCQDIPDKHFLFRSLDSGNTWSSVDTGAFLGPFAYCLAHLDGKLFAGPTNKPGIAISTDAGMSWFSQDSAIGDQNVYCMTTLGHILFAGAGPYIFRTVDSGLHWNRVLSGFGGIGALITGGTDLFAGTEDGVLVSSDSGMTWGLIDGLVNSPFFIKALMLFGNDIFAGTEGGEIWRHSLNEFNAVKNSSFVESSMPSFSIFPNPSSSNMTISFSTGKREQVKILIIDALGKECLQEQRTLNENMNEIGVDMTNYSKGVYTVRISSASGSVSKQFIKQD
jgi:hypothetical protein